MDNQNCQEDFNPARAMNNLKISQVQSKKISTYENNNNSVVSYNRTDSNDEESFKDKSSYENMEEMSMVEALLDELQSFTEEIENNVMRSHQGTKTAIHTFI